jgi:diacylglycerol kinase family enzyme
MLKTNKEVSKKENDKVNIKIEIQNYSVYKKSNVFMVNNSLNSKLNELWKGLDSNTDGLLEVVYSSDNGMHILVNCGNIIWTVYKKLVIMKKGEKILYRYDSNGKFQNEIIHSIPLNQMMI